MNKDNVTDITISEKDVIYFFTTLLDEHLEKNWDPLAVDWAARLTTPEGQNIQYFIWSESFKLMDRYFLPYNPSREPGERFPTWVYENKAGKQWLAESRGSKRYLEIKAPGVSTAAKSSITVYGVPVEAGGGIFIDYRIFSNNLICTVPKHLEKAVLKWALKHKRYIHSRISPAAYFQKDGSESQNSQLANHTHEVPRGPRSVLPRPNKNNVVKITKKQV